MDLATARGAILEELVLHLLRMVGYRVIKPGDDEATRAGKAGLELRGRGGWHQIDAMAAFDQTPAFMYPLRLLVEAKCYKRGHPVGIEIARNAVGVLKDISEEYSVHTVHGHQVRVPRWNYHAAIFSTSGYTSGAQRYALAHQVFLIQYERVALLRPVIDGLLSLKEEHFRAGAGADGTRGTLAVRTIVEEMLVHKTLRAHVDASPFTEIGEEHLRTQIVQPLLGVGGSYFGTLQGRWPMHLLSKKALPADVFDGRDEVACKIYGKQARTWSFAPTGKKEGEPGWFRLEFDLPDEIVAILKKLRDDPHAVADVKRQHFSHLDVSGKIGGINRQVRLKLDANWLSTYLAKIKGTGPTS